MKALKCRSCSEIIAENATRVGVEGMEICWSCYIYGKFDTTKSKVNADAPRAKNKK